MPPPSKTIFLSTLSTLDPVLQKYSEKDNFVLLALNFFVLETINLLKLQNINWKSQVQFLMVSDGKKVLDVHLCTDGPAPV